MMRIYLDNCCLQRPLDNQAHPRIRVETEAVFVVLCAVQDGELILVGSEALDFEVSRIPDETRRTEVISMLSLASEYVEISDSIETVATSFEKVGIRAMDAIHLATASQAKVDYFCTCDDKLLRCAQSITGLGCKAISLLGLIPEISK